MAIKIKVIINNLHSDFIIERQVDERQVDVIKFRRGSDEDTALLNQFRKRYANHGAFFKVLLRNMLPKLTAGQIDASTIIQKLMAAVNHHEESAVYPGIRTTDNPFHNHDAQFCSGCSGWKEFYTMVWDYRTTEADIVEVLLEEFAKILVDVHGEYMEVSALAIESEDREIFNFRPLAEHKENICFLGGKMFAIQLSEISDPVTKQQYDITSYAKNITKMMVGNIDTITKQKTAVLDREIQKAKAEVDAVKTKSMTDAIAMVARFKQLGWEIDGTDLVHKKAIKITHVRNGPNLFELRQEDRGKYACLSLRVSYMYPQVSSARCSRRSKHPNCQGGGVCIGDLAGVPLIEFLEKAPAMLTLANLNSAYGTAATTRLRSSGAYPQEIPPEMTEAERDVALNGRDAHNASQIVSGDQDAVWRTDSA